MKWFPWNKLVYVLIAGFNGAEDVYLTIKSSIRASGFPWQLYLDILFHSCGSRPLDGLVNGSGEENPLHNGAF